MRAARQPPRRRTLTSTARGAASIVDGDDPEPFAPQVDLGIALNAVIRDWLIEQLGATSDSQSTANADVSAA